MKLNKKQIFARLGDVDDRFVDESALPEETVAEHPKRRHAVAAFFEKPAVVAAVCAIVALGTVAGIVAAGHAAGEPVPPISGTVSGDPHLQETVNGETDLREQETDLAYVGDIVRHGDLYYVSHGNGTCSLVGIAALPEDMVLTIPETAVNGDRVVALRDMTMTSSLAVPNGVHLFQVKGIHIPASMTSVHINTLHEMTALESLTVDEGNPVYRAEGSCLIEREGERLVYAYLTYSPGVNWGNENPQMSLQVAPHYTYVIPSTVKCIAQNALSPYKPTQMPTGFFVSCTVPASVEVLETKFLSRSRHQATVHVSTENPNYYSSYNCVIEKATGTLVVGAGGNRIIPDGVTAIAPYAFWGAGLTSLHIPASVESIGELAFWNNPDLESITADICAMPKVDLNLDADGNFSCYYVEKNCLVLGEIKVKDGTVTTMHTLVLGCASSVIPAHVTHIGDYAFAWNKGLTEIDLPAGLQSIGFKAFAHCPNLTTIRYDNTYERWCQVAVDNTWLYDNGQMTELYFTDMDIPMTVVGVEFDYTGKGEAES